MAQQRDPRNVHGVRVRSRQPSERGPRIGRPLMVFLLSWALASISSKIEIAGADDVKSGPLVTGVVREWTRISEFERETASWEGRPSGTVVAVAKFFGDGGSGVLLSEPATRSFFTARIERRSGRLSVFAIKLVDALGGETPVVILPGDIDGDGCDDLLAHRRDATSERENGYFVAVSDCNGGFSKGALRFPDSSSPITGLMLADRHGAGRKQIFTRHSTSAGKVWKTWRLPVREDDNFSAQPAGGWSATEILGEEFTEVADGPLLGFGAFFHASAATQTIYRQRSAHPESEVFRIGGGDAHHRIGDVWAELPWSPSDTEQFFLADFNGDGLDDLLVRSPSSILGWWMAIATTGTALERPIVGIPFQAVTPGRAFSVDVDGDGVSEILAQQEGSDDLAIYRPRAGAPLPDFSFLMDGSHRIQTDDSGRFEIRGVLPGEHVLEWGRGKQKYSKHIFLLPTVKKLQVSLGIVPGDLAEGPLAQLLGQNTRPAVCLSYVTGQGDIKWGPSLERCPRGYAIFSANEYAAGPNLHGPLYGTCCPLPSSDLLEEETSVVKDECPPESVVVGFESIPLSNGGFDARLICQRINTRRYRLGEPTKAAYWGVSMALPKESPGILKDQMPAALRYGIERTGYRTWEQRGCIGQPWGSVLVSFFSGACDNQRFRQFLYADAPEEPLKARPVTMFPDCREIENIFDPLSGCKR